MLNIDTVKAVIEETTQVLNNEDDEDWSNL
jgi:hypothetical protein